MILKHAGGVADGSFRGCPDVARNIQDSVHNAQGSKEKQNFVYFTQKSRKKFSESYKMTANVKILLTLCEGLTTIVTTK